MLNFKKWEQKKPKNQSDCVRMKNQNVKTYGDQIYVCITLGLHGTTTKLKSNDHV